MSNYQDEYEEYVNSDNRDSSYYFDECADGDNVVKYGKHYSNDGLFSKIVKHYKQAGRKLIELVITLYYSMFDSDTPAWAKTVILGALGYFILPVDIIPDFVPIVGFSDDIASITAAIAVVALYIKPEHKDKAKDKINGIFGR